MINYKFVGFPMGGAFLKRRFEGLLVRELETACGQQKGLRMLKSNLSCLAILPKILVFGAAFAQLIWIVLFDHIFNI